MEPARDAARGGGWGVDVGGGRSRRGFVRTRADWTLLAGEAFALEEYRIERALHQFGLPAGVDRWPTMADTLYSAGSVD